MNDARFSATTTSGRVVSWLGGSLWIGRGSGHTQWHAHHAHQVTLPLQGAFRFRTEADGPWTAYGGAALVPSLCTHQFSIDAGTETAHLFIEPESRAGRALSVQFGRGAIAVLPTAPAQAAARRLHAALHAPGGPCSGTLADAGRQCVQLLCGAPAGEPDAALDARLQRALAHMRAHVDEPLQLGDVASAVALSESRFRHLFVAATGSSFRAYLLWLRINLAIDAVMAGASWTDAAHAAGFADSAHLSRTHKRMFGIEPTALRPMPEAAAGVIPAGGTGVDEAGTDAAA